VVLYHGCVERFLENSSSWVAMVAPCKGELMPSSPAVGLIKKKGWLFQNVSIYWPISDFQFKDILFHQELVLIFIHCAHLQISS